MSDEDLPKPTDEAKDIKELRTTNSSKFNHKKKWIIGTVVLVLLLGVIAGGAYLVFKGRIGVTSAERQKNLYDGEIQYIVSENDTDGDGVDDRTDILNGALAYIQTCPKYKSRYYSGGYPDDGYGVCTDVVAFAFRSAGFDLMELVQEDITAHPDDYNIDEPDANIDFRRVVNLEVYFKHTAESLTTDPTDIEEWQGGDIVIFPHHIGIVSDRRNADGITYIIHHDNPAQIRYEEDELSSRTDIVGHYRMP